jgi:hypothetical protein
MPIITRMWTPQTGWTIIPQPTRSQQAMDLATTVLRRAGFNLDRSPGSGLC